MAKVLGSEALGRVVDEGVQTFGGYGFMQRQAFAEHAQALEAIVQTAQAAMTAQTSRPRRRRWRPSIRCSRTCARS